MYTKVRDGALSRFNDTRWGKKIKTIKEKRENNKIHHKRRNWRKINEAGLETRERSQKDDTGLRKSH